MTKERLIKRLLESDSGTVARLLKLGGDTPESWQPEDLRAMVDHQLRALLAFDLGSDGPNTPGGLRESIREAKRSGIRSFIQMFRSPKPPLDLLLCSKEFFKQAVDLSKAGAAEVAGLFYMLSIGIAYLRHEVPLAEITKLTPLELLQNIDFLSSKPWVSPEARSLLAEVRPKIKAAAQ